MRNHSGMRTVLALVLSLAAAAGACGGHSSTPAGGGGVHVNPGRPCGSVTRAPAYQHVIVIVMENHGFSQVAGHSPFLNRLAARCGLAASYRAVSHPSLPNYLTIASGSPQNLQGYDCQPGPGCDASGASIFGQTTWRVFAQSMPGPCFRKNSGDYAPRHNPALYFTAPTVTSACAASDLPLTGDALTRALSSPASLAHYVMVIPNLCNDEHDCPVSSGDLWLSRMVPQILHSAAYRSGTTALFITYDEDDHAEGNRVYTVVVSPSTRPGTVSQTGFTHASLLRTSEELLGLPVLPAAGSTASMRAAFNL
jgi:phosphatidylinositol-3-phosphatase